MTDEKLYSLLYPKDMPHFPEIDMPRNFYVVLTRPAPLAGMPYPSDQTPWKTFYDSGFSNVICLADADPVYEPNPLNILYSGDFEDYTMVDCLGIQSERRGLLVLHQD